MKKPFYKQWWAILIAALVVIYGLSAIAYLSDDEASPVESASDNEEKEKVSKPVKKEELTVDKKIEKAVIKAIGKETNFDKPRVVSVTYSEENKSAVIVLNADESLTNNLTKKSMWINIADVFEKIEGIKEVSLYTFQWQFPLVDQYGNEKDGVVMSFDITRDEIQKINFDNFLPDNVPKIVTNYFEHAAFN